MRTLATSPAVKTKGFTLLELMASLAILLIMMAGVFSQLSKLQQTYRTEENKVDTTQEGRNVLDNISREVHQAGYPGDNLFNPNILANPVMNDSRVAAGLVRVTPQELWFEGDIDSDGAVDVVDYMLYDSAGNVATAASTCPCTLRRSQTVKVNNTAPLAQVLPGYNVVLSNVLNSGGVPAANTGLALTGSTNGTSNNVLYAAYKNANLFTALDRTGTPVPLPVDLNNAVLLSTVKSIIVNVNTLSINFDAQTRAQLPASLSTTAKLNN